MKITPFTMTLLQSAHGQVHMMYLVVINTVWQLANESLNTCCAQCTVTPHEIGFYLQLQRKARGLGDFTTASQLLQI